MQQTKVKKDAPQSTQTSSTVKDTKTKSKTSDKQHTSSPNEIHIPWPDRGTCEIIQPIEKKPHLRSKQPLRRIEIVESDTSELPINKKQTTMDKASEFNVDYKESDALAKILAQTSKLDVDEILNDIDSNVETSNKQETDAQSNLKITEIVDTTQGGLATVLTQSSEVNMEELLNNVTSDPAKLDTISKLNVKENTPEKCRKVSFSEKVELIPKQETFETENDPVMDELMSDDNEQCMFPVPKTAHSFYTDWCQIKNDQMQKNLYLKQIPPSELPSIFQHALESDVFSQMIRILSEYFIANDLQVYEYVKYLSEVKRFSTMIMFAGKEDKIGMYVLLLRLFFYILIFSCLALKKIFDYMAGKTETSTEDIEALKIKYEL